MMPDYRGFCSEVALMKFRAGNLGLLKTMHALEAAVTAVGYEVAEILMKKGNSLGHKWFVYVTKSAVWPCCEYCGVVQLAEGLNKPCPSPGVVKVLPRDKNTKKHKWDSPMGNGWCEYCHLRRKFIAGPDGGTWVHYWSAYAKIDIPDHPKDRKGVPPCPRETQFYRDRG